jgi:hypothetical protein
LFVKKVKGSQVIEALGQRKGGKNCSEEIWHAIGGRKRLVDVCIPLVSVCIYCPKAKAMCAYRQSVTYQNTKIYPHVIRLTLSSSRMKDAHLQAAAPRHRSLALRKSPSLEGVRVRMRASRNLLVVWDTNLARTHDRLRTRTCAVRCKVWVGGAENTG